MLENALFTLIMNVIKTGLTANGLTNVLVKQMFQPAQDGTNTAPTCYLHRISDHRYGFPEKIDIYNSTNHNFDHIESEVYESVFQATILSKVDPANPASLAAPTALDIANTITAILQNDATIATLLQSNVQILRITDIRKPNFIDDKGQFESSPNFDFTITHQQDIINTVPIISKINSGIYPI